LKIVDEFKGDFEIGSDGKFFGIENYTAIESGFF
jgi:hypothetical protein